MIIMEKKKFIQLYRTTGLIAAIIFFIVGLIFLFIPDRVLDLFNNISVYLNMPRSHVDPDSIYLALAVAYMYLVGVFAFLMYSYPEKNYAFFLSHGKIASAAVSLYMFIWHQPYLIYLTNTLLDGLIGLTALLLYLKMERIRS